MNPRSHRFRFVRGDTIEAQIASIETTLSRFSRRLWKNADVIIPPIPIFFTGIPDENGLIGRVLLPVEGYFHRFFLYANVPKNVKPSMVVSVRRIGESVITTYEFRITDGLSSVDTEILAPAGSLVCVSLKDFSGVTDACISCTCDIAVSGLSKESFLIDKLLSNVETEDACETEGREPKELCRQMSDSPEARASGGVYGSDSSSLSPDGTQVVETKEEEVSDVSAT